MDKNKRKKIEIVAIPVLLAVFGIVLWTSLGKVGLFGPKARPLEAVSSRPAQAKAGPSAGISETKPGWGRDPFTLRETSATDSASIQNLRLMGITRLTDKGAYKAIINDEFVTAGSKVGSFTVIEVNERAVKVKDDSGVYDLRIREEL